MHARRTRSPCRRHAGLTFLETVLGVVLIGMVASAIASVAGSVELSRTRREAELGAGELANRLVLQFLDDDDSMPSGNLPVEYDARQYRWSMSIGDVTAKLDPAGARSGADINTGERSLSRLQHLTVRVWLAEGSGGSFRRTTGVPNATVSRLFDPLLPSNPDSLYKALSTPEGIAEIIAGLQDVSEGRDVNTTTPGGGEDQP